MKKQYIIPEMEIVQTDVHQQILAGSNEAPGLNGEYTGGQVLAPSMESDFDYPE